MKIQGPQPLLNTYKQLQQQQITKKNPQYQDQLNISAEAKKMQQNQFHELKRSEYVEEIKDKVQSGEYKVDSEKTAQKMINFLSKSW